KPQKCSWSVNGAGPKRKPTCAGRVPARRGPRRQVLSFDYLLDKIRQADFVLTPFRHIQINDFFNQEHFSLITAAPEIAIAGVDGDRQLFDVLFNNGYKIIEFPGCITSKEEYLRWHKAKGPTHHNSTACEGFGVTLRLMSAQSPVIRELI